MKPRRPSRSHHEDALACGGSSRATTAARHHVVPLLIALFLLLLTSCAGEFDMVGEALRLLDTSMPDAVLQEPYEEPLQAVGGLRPYSFTIDGALPAGLSLSGGSVRGTPSEVGTFTFTVQVSDANLSQVSREFRLRVTEVPPPQLTLSVPNTEVRGPVTVRVGVASARALMGVSLLLSWDSDRFELREGSVTARQRRLALFEQSAPGELRVDLAALGRTLSGELDLFTFTLEPTVSPTTLSVRAEAEFASDSPDLSRRHQFSEVTAGRRGPLPTVEQDEEFREKQEDPLDDGFVRDDDPEWGLDGED